MHGCLYVSANVHVYVRVSVRLNANVNVYMCVDVHVYPPVHVHTGSGLAIPCGCLLFRGFLAFLVHPNPFPVIVHRTCSCTFQSSALSVKRCAVNAPSRNSRKLPPSNRKQLTAVTWASWAALCHRLHQTGIRRLTMNVILMNVRHRLNLNNWPHSWMRLCS